MRATCPECNHEYDMEYVATVPKEQRMILSIETENEMFAAGTVGGTISDVDKLMSCVAKDVGYKVVTFISNIVFDRRKISIEFLILRVPHKSREIKK